MTMETTNRYELTDEVKAEIKPQVEQFIKDLEAVDVENSTDYLVKDFSGTRINPYTLGKILEELGYENEDGIDTNGWQMDFWIRYTKNGFRTIQLSGCGITFEVKLSEIDE
jgi:hypothetical protein